MRDCFGEIIAEIGAENEEVVVVDSDVAHPTRAHLFEKKFPERFIQLGVAEQNAVGFAAGVSTLGFIPIVNMFACFASKRACEQISISVAYPRLNVKICGCYAGITTPNTGATHQAFEDVAIMRALPNMLVIEPADERELAQVLRGAIHYNGPVYLRVVRCGLPTVLPADYRFKIGQAVILKEGSDITLIGSGLMVSRCLEAAEMLAQEGISAQVINVSTIKPIDVNLITQAAKKTGRIVTVENHGIIGGLGSAVAEVLAENYPVPLKRVGIEDAFGESGKLDDLLKKYGLTTERVKQAAQEIMEK